MKSFFQLVPLILIMLLFNSALVAQYLPDGGRLVSHQNWPDSFSLGGPALLVDSLETSSDALIVNREDLEIVKIYMAGEVPEVFSQQAGKGLLVAKTAPGTDLLRLADVLDHFEVPARNRELRVLVNKGLVEDPSLLLADINRIEKIEVVKLNLTLDNVSWSIDPDEKYINISTFR